MHRDSGSNATSSGARVSKPRRPLQVLDSADAREHVVAVRSFQQHCVRKCSRAACACPSLKDAVEGCKAAQQVWDHKVQHGMELQAASVKTDLMASSEHCRAEDDSMVVDAVLAVQPKCCPLHVTPVLCQKAV